LATCLFSKKGVFPVNFQAMYFTKDFNLYRFSFFR